MSYQVLARKWRPKNFNDVRGQEHITRTLINSIKNDKVAHAYLLTGTRGIGKTTIARIFAKAIRCENLSPEGNPCLECNSCQSIESTNSLDYIEIDGASNNSVDDIRELIESVQYLPTSGKYKVFVIDEVHMLTVSAFNALLKTLEEPPEHVVFIFATTDPQKLLGTVLSRCQRFDFKNSSPEETQKLLLDIAAKEGIKFEKDSLALELAKQGKGSFRDSLSLFDQVISLSSSETITEDALMLSLGMAKSRSVIDLIHAVLKQDKAEVLKVYNSVLNENIDLKVFSKQVLDKLYSLISEIDDSGSFAADDLDENVLANVSLVEVVWIYESLAKDLEWALNSFDPEKICGFSFIKSAIREKILNYSSEPISVKKKLVNDSSEEKKTEEVTPSVEPQIEVEKEIIIEKAVVEPVQELEEPAVEVAKEVEEPVAEAPVEEVKPAEPVIAQEDKSWEGFIKYLYKNSKSHAVNLERGNLLNKEDFLTKSAYLKVAFTQKCRIFYDFLTDPERRTELNDLLCEYLGVTKEELNLNFEMMDDETKESTNFMSSVEIEEDAIRKNKEVQKTNILNNKYIKEAEDLFNSKIDRVVLNDDE